LSAELTDRVAAWRGRGEATDFDGHRIHLFARGGEGPTLLLLHGFPSCSYDWRLLIELESERAVVAPDYLGYGFSDKPRDHDYTLVSSADLAEEVVRRQALGAPVFAVGHDIGTSVANELMARDLDGTLAFELAGVLLLNGSMVQDAASPTLGQRLLRGRLGPLVSRLSSERFFRDQFGSIFSPDHPLTEQEAADQWSLISYGEGHRIGHRLIRYMDERMERAERWHGAIRNWPGPLSIAWGMVDPVATPSVLAAVRELRPAAPLTEWDDLGHYPQLEDPARVSAALGSALGASL
jgi:pimeloyl-ACP methyl ester carboxylesterase